MSLSKIPVIVLLTIGLNAMLTAPHGPPPKEEIKHSPASDIIPFRSQRMSVARLGQILAAAAEIAIILAQASPNYRLSQQVLATALLKDGHPEKLRLSSAGILGAALWLSGAALRVRAFRELGNFFRLDISIQKEHKLVVSGPYAYVRHPSYSGVVLTTLGWFLWNGAAGSWVRESGIWNTLLGRSTVIAYALFGILPLSVVTLSRMWGEDQVLRKQFGQEWDAWARKVPYLVIPGIY